MKYVVKTMSRENLDSRAEKMGTGTFEYLKCIVDGLNRLFNILFSCEGLIVRDISIDVRKQQTLGKFMAQAEKQLQMPSEVAIVEVSVKLELEGPLDIKFLADIAESIEKACLKASFSISELDMKINVASIPLT